MVKRTIQTMVCAGCMVVLGIALLADAAVVSEGIRNGILVCGNVLIPSLFPFMVLSGFISRTRYARVLSWPLRPIAERVYRLPPQLGVIVLLSLIGGYPVGARMVANLLEQGSIDRATAERMLCFCVNCGPSFLISAVGVGMLLNRTAGILLFATQTAATLIIGAAVSRRACRVRHRTEGAGPDMSGVPAMVAAVTGASAAMLTMCAFAVLFSGLLALVRSVGVIEAAAALLPVRADVLEALICGFFEVTAGCISASAVGGTAGFALICICVSFGGLSVLFQVMSCFGQTGVRFRGLILSRLVHAGLSTVMAVPLYGALCAQLPVWASAQAPILYSDRGTWIISICLLAMCSILVLQSGRDNMQ